MNKENNGKSSLRVLLIDPITHYSDQMNLGLVYLGSFIESKGYPVRIVDMNFRKYDAYKRLDEALLEFKPDVIGVSIISYFAFPEVRKLLKELRSRTKSRLVAGGSSPSMFPERMLTENAELDFLIFGEGENTFSELLLALSSGSADLSGIKGLAYRKDGKVILNGKRPLVSDLDSLPMLNFELVDLVVKYGFSFYKDTYIMATSRGCPYACSFCLSNVLCGRSWKYFSPQRVVDEIEVAYKKYGLRRVSFQDDNFIMQPQRVVEICRQIRERGLKIKLWLDGGIRADRLTAEALRELCLSGLELGVLAVESGSPEVFEMIGKGETLPEVISALEMLKAANIELHIFMILGLPGDTHERFLQSLELARKYKVKCRWHFAFPFENTRMHDYVKQNGRFLRDVSGYDVDVVTGNRITSPGTMPLAFDTPDYPAKQRIADYYYAVIDSGAFFNIFAVRYKNNLLRFLRCSYIVLRYNPARFAVYLSWAGKTATYKLMGLLRMKSKK